MSALCSLYFSIITANNIWAITLSVCRVKTKRKRPIISIIWTAHRGSFRGLIVFCLNKSVNEQQSLDAGSSLRISADLGVPAELGQTLGKAKTNLSVSAGLGVLIREVLTLCPRLWVKTRLSLIGTNRVFLRLKFSQRGSAAHPDGDLLIPLRGHWLRN